MFPLLMMQIGREWSLGVVLIAEALIAALLILVELAARGRGNSAYRAGVILAVVACLLRAWINIVAEDSVNLGFFVVIMMVAAGALAVQGEASGMTRLMLGTAVVHALVTSMIATDPHTAAGPPGGVRVLLLNGYFVVLWLVSALAFWLALRPERRFAART
jgi:hypothetical protein